MRIESTRPSWRLALWAGPMAVLVLAIVFVSGTPARGLPASATVSGQAVTVLSGSYSCDVNDVLYVELPGTEPETFRETVDRISFGSTGGVMSNLPGGVTPVAIGPGYGGRRVLPAIPDIGGLFTGHSFDGGTIEDCLRFANSVASAAQSLGCVVSDVRHRQRVYSSESASVSFVCEGPAADQLHAIGELSRLVITLKPQP